MEKRTAAGDSGQWIVAVDIGGTRFRVAAVSDDGKIMRRTAEPTQVIEGRDAVLARIYTAIRDTMASMPSSPVAVGVAAPGPLNPWTGVIYEPPNMQGWHTVPIKALMEAALSLPVIVGNDANVAALGEHRFGAGQGYSDIAYFTVSTGIGGGIIANNELLLGAQGLAAEFGHMTILPGGPPCGCGNSGCLEALSSGTAIARRMREAIIDGETSVVLERAGGDPGKVNAELVEQAARDGDVVASRILREAAEYLGIGISNVVHLLNPQMVIIGGGVSNVGALLLEPVWRVVNQRTMVALRTNLQIVPAKLGDDVGLLGCAALALPDA